MALRSGQPAPWLLAADDTTIATVAAELQQMKEEQQHGR